MRNSVLRVKFVFTLFVAMLAIDRTAHSTELEEAGVTARAYMLAVFSQDTATAITHMDPEVMKALNKTFLDELKKKRGSVAEKEVLSVFGVKSREEALALDPAELYARMLDVGMKKAEGPVREAMKASTIKVLNVEKKARDRAAVKLSVSFSIATETVQEETELLLRDTGAGWKVVSES